MRHLLQGLAVVVIAAIGPAVALGGNQEVANAVAKNLRESGQLVNYKISVKVLDGTAWLKGRVTDEQQMGAALRLAMGTEGVRRVVNQLEIQSPEVVELAKPPVAYQEADPGVQPASATQLQPATVEAPRRLAAQGGRPLPVGYSQPVAPQGVATGAPAPMYTAGMGGSVAPVRYDQPNLPNYAWPSYAAYPNYAALTYPKQYSPTAWPYIGPFYPYPQVPLGWRRVTLEWDDGWWYLDFKDTPRWCDTPIGSWR